MQVDTPLAIYNDPANMFVAGFIGSPPMNFFHGTCQTEGEETYFIEKNDQGEIAMKYRLNPHLRSQVESGRDQNIVLGIRPEHIDVTNQAGTDSIEAIVDVSEPMGAETFLYLKTLAGKPFIARVGATHDFKIGHTVHLTFETEKVAFFDPETEAVYPKIA